MGRLFVSDNPRRARLLTIATVAVVLAPWLPIGVAHATQSGTHTTSPATSPPVPGATADTSLLVGVAPDTSTASQSAIAQAAGAHRSARLSRSVLEVQVAPGTTAQQAARLRGRHDVRYVEPNAVIHASATPNDPGFVDEWGLQSAAPGIGASTAWDRTTGSSSIVVGVLDSGIDLSHPDLVANLWSNPGGVGGCGAGTHGVNEIEGGCVPQDGFGHGTHVAGTIGATGNNGAGVVGVNWSTSLMGLRMLDNTGMGSTATAVAAIEFAVQAKTQGGVNIRVLNASWGDQGGPPSNALKSAIQDAGNAGILFVAAAGNAAQGAAAVNLDVAPRYPCSFHLATMICVGATTNSPADTLAGFSNYGANSVDIAAPGDNVVSTWPGGQYQVLSGTSMATPHVSGAAALMLAASDMPVSTLKTMLLTHAAPIPALSGLVSTGGRLDVACAVGATLAHWCAWDAPVPPLSGGVGSAPAITSWASGRLDVFASDAGGQLAHTWSAGQFSGWETFSGGIVGPPAAASWSAGRLDVFARGVDNQLLHKWFGNGWSAWEPLGGGLNSAPTVSSWGAGRLDAFVRGTDNQLWHKWFANGWSGWEPLGGQAIGDPAAVSWSPGRIDVFVRGTDNQLWHKWFSGAWSGWEPIGGPAAVGIAASSRGAGVLDVFVTGTDAHLWHKWFGGAWHGFEDLGGGNLTTGPAAVSWDQNRIDIVSRATDSQLTHLVFR